MHPLFQRADQLSHTAIGAAIEVHRLLGPGFLEKIYERAMVHELGLRGLKLGMNYQRADLLGPRAWEVYARAEKLKLPVLFHMGTSPIQMAPLEEA